VLDAVQREPGVRQTELGPQLQQSGAAPMMAAGWCR
jgi:hypothetical protein